MPEKITKQLFNTLDYDFDMSAKKVPIIPITAAGEKLDTPSAQLIFAKSDLNAAAYHLAKSLNSPFSPNAIAAVFVEEAAREDFIARLQPLLKTIPAAIAQHAERQRALAVVSQHKWNTITAAGLGVDAPILVCDVTHEQLGAGATGLITLHTFRTAKEAIALCGKESLKFVNASIWHGNHACAYEVALGLSSGNCYINCHDVSLEPLRAGQGENSSCVLVENSYHYEKLSYKGVQKQIVFPIGTIFAN